MTYWFGPMVMLQNGRQLLPPNTPLYNKYVGGAASIGLRNLVFEPSCLRNIEVGEPAAADGLHIGEIVRFQTCTSIYNLRGRKTNTPGSAVRVRGCHHEGNNHFAHGCNVDPPFLDICRIVYIDICKLNWCSLDMVSFHSFAWPRNVGKAKRIVRALFSNHCNWVGVLIMRGRCFSSQEICFRANRTLENLMWNWSKMQRLYLVYQEGSGGH